MASSISVVVRVRPFSIREAAQLSRPDDAPTFFGDGSLAAQPKPTLTGKGMRRVVKVIDENMLVFDPAEENPMARYQKTILPQGKRVKDMRFGFDRVFDETCTQQDVYEATTRTLLDSVLDGFNATVFAYGATGCGKTHTISGNPKNPGIIFLTCAELFERIDALQDEKDINLTLSYLEIYNETIRDLLVPGGSKLGLQLREDNNSNISVAGLSTHQPKTVEQVMDMIVMGNANRTQSPTDANATSSRSHAVLQINVIQKPRTAGIKEDHMASTLSIIDLAGSERASVTKNRGDRLLEGANINRSLLALGNCINSLCDPAKRNHIPYRDSKLTRLLKFSLGGNCKTVMIVCVSPSSAHYDETHNTLKYANRAKNIKTKVSRNIINVNRHVSEYVKMIYNLNQEVDGLKARLKEATKEAAGQLNKSRVAKDASIKDGLSRIRTAYEQTKKAREEKAQMFQSFRLLESRMTMINAWLAAFDEVFEARQEDALPATLLNMRAEADKVMKELHQNEQLIKQRLSSQRWEKTIDTALQHSVRSLQAIEGVTEADVSLLTTEANLLKTAGERDVLHVLNASDVDITTSIQTLATAHFETYTMIGKLMSHDFSDEEKLEAARKSLFSIQKGAGDAISTIVKPSGELVSRENYQPLVQPSPRKKKHSYIPSPVKVSGSALPVASPLRSPQRKLMKSPIKVKSPKKGVSFPKKHAEKKRVRWNEELEDPVSEDSKRSRFLMNDYFYGPADDDDEVEEEDLAPPPPQPSFRPQPAAQGVSAPPIRPRGNLVGRSLAAPAKPRDPGVPMDHDTVEQAISQLAEVSGGGYASAEDSTARPWRTRMPPHRPRKSMGGAIRPTAKRRSPTSSSQTSPENTSQCGAGILKRLPQTGHNASGSFTSVLSPKSTGVAGSKARRQTVSTAGVNFNALALAGYKMDPPATKKGPGAR
ncbi:P-loop containing nucleoside triphosphate hydrolase protein [Sphaerosporella brunnea]|uniref:Kinesin-like protein n=1 Tax=Sphaerosporella brunnea TaxID=1250544 RepID=A0A5J5F896_9PEZI|nr:P-loop containing nucleoside triphosphate hydrolase protein [Sphaerosporella brunnea]